MSGRLVGPSGLAQLLRERRDEIVSSFVAEVRGKELSPPGVARSSLVDHIPRFIDEIVAELEQGERLRASQDAVDTSETARRHGEQRWSLGYDLAALIREYGVLRHCILDAAKATDTRISIDEFDVLAKCVSVGVSEAADEYIQYRDHELDGQKANLEFLAEAGQLLSSSLDYRSTLRRLTGLLVPRMADWCAVHLEGTPVTDMPIAHVDPQKQGLLRELFIRFPPMPDSPSGYPYAARTGESQMVSEVLPGYFESIAESDEHLSLIRALDTCS